jgi:hypothetical protein
VYGSTACPEVTGEADIYQLLQQAMLNYKNEAVQH